MIGATFTRNQLNQIISTFDTAFQWCQDMGIIMKDPNCPNCGEELILYLEKRVYRCNKRTCKVLGRIHCNICHNPSKYVALSRSKAIRFYELHASLKLRQFPDLVNNYGSQLLNFNAKNSAVFFNADS